MYELFTGQAAFQADSVAAFARLHQRAKPKPPSELVHDIAPVVDRLIQQCLEKDPANRFQSAKEILAEVRASLTSTSARRRSRRYRAWPGNTSPNNA